MLCFLSDAYIGVWRHDDAMMRHVTKQGCSLDPFTCITLVQPTVSCGPGRSSLSVAAVSCQQLLAVTGKGQMQADFESRDSWTDIHGGRKCATSMGGKKWWSCIRDHHKYAGLKHQTTVAQINWCSHYHDRLFLVVANLRPPSHGARTFATTNNVGRIIATSMKWWS